MNQNIYKVYAKIDNERNVVSVFSDAFKEVGEDDVLLKEGVGDEFVHVQGLFELYDEYGRHNYKIEHGLISKIDDKDKPIAQELVQDEINALLFLEIAKLKAGAK